jgi:hypothetical protein
LPHGCQLAAPLASSRHQRSERTDSAGRHKRSEFPSRKVCLAEAAQPRRRTSISALVHWRHTEKTDVPFTPRFRTRWISAWNGTTMGRAVTRFPIAHGQWWYRLSSQTKSRQFDSRSTSNRVQAARLRGDTSRRSPEAERVGGITTAPLSSLRSERQPLPSQFRLIG